MTQKVRLVVDELSYYKGEVDDKGQFHGVGLLITPFKQIEEAFWKNGSVCGQRKYVLFEENNEGQVQFKMFGKSYYDNKLGWTGHFQLYNHNGRVIHEGYQKDYDYCGEQKLCSHNNIEYAKMVA